MHRTTQFLLTAQLSLFIGLFVCVLLIPHFLFESNEGGISNYGTYAKTVIPFTIGLGICGAATIMAAWSLPKTLAARRRLHLALLVLGALYGSALVSTYPYKLGAIFDYLHQFIGAVLIIYSLGLGAWLTWFKAHTIVTVLLYGAQIIGFALTVLTFFSIVHTLFIAELLMSLAFGALLVISIDKLTASAHAGAATS